MSVCTGPFALTPGTLTQITPPQQSVSYGAVVLTNLSPYICQVQISGNYFWLSPFEEQIYDLTFSNHANVAVLPSLLLATTVPTGISGQINATWFSPNEVPRGNWPFSLSANAVESLATFTFVPLILHTVAPGGSVTVETDAFASINLRLTTTAPVGNVGVITYLWFSDAALTHLTGADNLTLGSVADNTTDAIWEMPVRGAFLQIVVRAQSIGNIIVVVNGSNRIVPAVRMVLTAMLPRAFTVSGNFVINTPVAFTATDGLGNYTTLNGLCYALMSIAVLAGTGNPFVRYINFSGSIANIILGTPLSQAVNHPMVPCNWGYIPSNAAAGQTINLLVVPADQAS